MRLTPGSCIIKLFTAVINYVVQYANAFAITSHFSLVLTNESAFFVKLLITAVISFMIQAPSPSESAFGLTMKKNTIRSSTLAGSGVACTH